MLKYESLDNIPGKHDAGTHITYQLIALLYSKREALITILAPLFSWFHVN